MRGDSVMTLRSPLSLRPSFQRLALHCNSDRAFLSLFVLSYALTHHQTLTLALWPITDYSQVRCILFPDLLEHLLPDQLLLHTHAKWTTVHAANLLTVYKNASSSGVQAATLRECAAEVGLAWLNAPPRRGRCATKGN